MTPIDLMCTPVYPILWPTVSSTGLGARRLDSQVVAYAVSMYRHKERKDLPVRRPSIDEVGMDFLYRQVLELVDDRICNDAKLNCLRFLKEYVDKHKAILRPTDISSDGEEGLIIEWKRGGRYFDLNWPELSSAEPYLYFSTPSQFGAKKPLTDQLLKERLDWVQSEVNG